MITRFSPIAAISVRPGNAGRSAAFRVCARGAAEAGMDDWRSAGHFDVLAAGRAYVRLGLRVAPVGFRTKSIDEPRFPVAPGDDELRRWFAPGPRNIGVLLGADSRGLVDVDLDSSEARAIAPALLPQTACVFGRPSSPRSHMLYFAAGQVPVSEQFKDLRLARGNDRMVVELRSTGCMTVFPPSTHPDGERITFDSLGPPAVVPGAHLVRLVRTIAAASVLARSFPARHRNAAAGGLEATIARWPELACSPARFVELVMLGAEARPPNRPHPPLDTTALQLAATWLTPTALASRAWLAWWRLGAKLSARTAPGAHPGR